MGTQGTYLNIYGSQGTFLNINGSQGTYLNIYCIISDHLAFNDSLT